jgi:hypothetical protein
LGHSKFGVAGTRKQLKRAADAGRVKERPRDNRENEFAALKFAGVGQLVDETPDNSVASDVESPAM